MVNAVQPFDFTIELRDPPFREVLLSGEAPIHLAGRDSAWYHLPAGKYLLRYAGGDGYRVAGVDLSLSWSPEANVGSGDFRRQGKTLLSPGAPPALPAHVAKL